MNSTNNFGMCDTCKFHLSQNGDDAQKICTCSAFMKSMYIDNGVAKCTAWKPKETNTVSQSGC